MNSETTKERTVLSGLAERCPERNFQPGDILREKGQHYTSMYLVVDGKVRVDLGLSSAPLIPDIGQDGLPIGEIGFLRGLPATATVVADTPVRALEISDAVLSKLETEAPDLAVILLRHLATTADERTSHNIALASTLPSAPKEQSIRILLCRDDNMLLQAKKLRYEVYCAELGRQSPHADHDRKIISDELDAFGHTFIAVEEGETIGTLRANRPADGPIGILETLYGMNQSPHNPESTVVCTKFIIASHKRTSTAGIKLVAGFARFGVQHKLRECYIDCIPSLRPFYTGLGFRKSGEKFLHRENGPSIPMMLDLEKSRRRIDRVLATLS
ncbi:MAG: cyclic nucleotide-binding domain-containing protein [Alphaproteobacteria bacterium]|nr:cyclic nucleotide-binding domain-containing protein [Alphaproteobacteria bacterium]